MNTILNNYTIEDFLKLKPIIYEYCCNLIKIKKLTSWNKELDDANDLYQDVYLFVHNTYFNKPKEAIEEGKFIQRMKNAVFWTFHSKMKKKGFKVDSRTNHYQESDYSFYLFDSSRYDTIKLYENIQDHPDYDFYMKDLKLTERLAIQYFMNGYTKTEVAKKFNKDYPFITRLVNKIEANANKDKFSKPLIKQNVKPIAILDDKLFVKSKISNFNKVFKDNKFIKLYSLHLQKVNHRIIAKELNKSVSQVNVEIYRINQKIKKYDS